MRTALVVLHPGRWKTVGALLFVAAAACSRPGSIREGIVGSTRSASGKSGRPKKLGSWSKLGLLMELEFRRDELLLQGERKVWKQPKPVSVPLARLTIIAVAWFERGDEGCYARTEEIAKRVGASTDQVKLALRCLVDLKLLKRWRFGGRRHLRIQWSAVRTRSSYDPKPKRQIPALEERQSATLGKRESATLAADSKAKAAISHPPSGDLPRHKSPEGGRALGRVDQ